MLLEGKLDVATASMAKYWVTELQSEVVDKCLQFHGGAGYINDYAIARMYRDTRIARIYGGSNEIMKMLIAKVDVRQPPVLPEQELQAKRKGRLEPSSRSLVAFWPKPAMCSEPRAQRDAILARRQDEGRTRVGRTRAAQGGVEGHPRTTSLVRLVTQPSIA